MDVSDRSFRSLIAGRPRCQDVSEVTMAGRRANTRIWVQIEQAGSSLKGCKSLLLIWILHTAVPLQDREPS